MLPILKNITHYTQYGVGIAVAASSSVLTLNYIIKDNEKNNERLSKLNDTIQDNTASNKCVKIKE